MAALIWASAIAPITGQVAANNLPDEAKLVGSNQPQPAFFTSIEPSQPLQSPYPSPGRKAVRAQAFAPPDGVQTRPLLALLTLPPDAALPGLQLISPPADQQSHLLVQPNRLSYAGPLPRLFAPTLPNPTPAAALVDGWTSLFATGFEESVPATSCAAPSSNSRRWTAINGNAASGYFSAWPLAIGNTGGAPQPTWLVCGPFAVAPQDRLLIQYSYRLATAADNQLFFGVSTDGKSFAGGATTGLAGDWMTSSVLVEGERGAQLWVGWAFSGEAATASANGAWLDNLRIWRYASPEIPCDPQVAGEKGVVLNPYDPTTMSPAPIIRPGDTVAVDQLVAADVHWVRLGFHSGEDGISLPEYDRMIDTLCAHGIGILGLLNHETLTRQDYRAGDESELTSYRAEFAGVAEFLAAYYAQRVQFWEVWNEPNLVEGAYLPPADYAQLLQRTYQGIKRANPGAEVLLGGLASAWSDSYDYLSAIYAELDNNLQGARPFDHLALHPYPRKTEGPDPAVYMFADRPAGYNTIIDKFLQVMAEHGDGDKSIWVTEIGWNSALDSPNRPLCFAPVLVPEAEQGRYLKSMFDILFNEVSYWGRPGERAVAKVFWYQYMDVGTLDPCDMTPQPKDWWFGLYRGDKVTPKRSWCAFAAYPQSCAEPESAQ